MAARSNFVSHGPFLRPNLLFAKSLASARGLVQGCESTPCEKWCKAAWLPRAASETLASPALAGGLALALPSTPSDATGTPAAPPSLLGLRRPWGPKYLLLLLSRLAARPLSPVPALCCALLLPPPEILGTSAHPGSSCSACQVTLQAWFPAPGLPVGWWLGASHGLRWSHLCEQHSPFPACAFITEEGHAWHTCPTGSHSWCLKNFLESRKKPKHEATAGGGALCPRKSPFVRLCMHL